ncbi:helix-turn-helix transcriptional regulator [Caldicellulosiruptor acetigenus]|uniref:helix-turn-helix domain-containing protein n=1 Tax=Caldicellulosiruptor acetigenus TaxID=301953 RepID=UPI0022A944CB|nr:helix-turn-helix transcriptional regulator [Caldicellulosiruptor acetigenus]WAM36616.1 helix-turn-helix transcriptional regulator [Caldicellulosiruptor acetigenus]
MERTKFLRLLGERIKQLREEKGYQQKDVAEKLGISKQAFSNYENGTREPNLLTVIEIADLFDVSVEYLLGLTTERKRSKELIFDENLDRNLSIEIMELIGICKELPPEAIELLRKIALELRKFLICSNKKS